MKKMFKRILALTLSTIMVSGSISAMASTYTNDFFDDSAKGYGSGIEYIEDLGQYVIGGKSFYSSTDGVNWIRRAGGIADMQSEITGFAYGGSSDADEKFFLMLYKYGTITADSNKTYLLDKYMAKRNIVYSYIDDNDTDTTNDVPLVLMGTLIWDDFTGKFWCGASKLDGTYAGLYYWDGTKERLDDKTRIYWTKADTGNAALYAETTAYEVLAESGYLQTMNTVLSNITTDGKGHIVAQPLWLSASAATVGTKTTAQGKKTANSAIFVDAATEGSYQAKTITCLVNQSYIGIDRYSNIISQQSYETATTGGPIRTHTFDAAFALDNGASLTKWGYIKDEKARSFPYQKYGMSSVVGKIISFEDKLVMVPRAGFGTEGTVEDVLVATYENANHALTGNKNKFYTYINNASKIQEILGTQASKKKYVADAVAAGENKVAFITGRELQKITSASAGEGSRVAVIDLTDAPTAIPKDITDTETGEVIEEATPAGDVDRSSKVTVTSTIVANGNAYSHISATGSPITVARDTEVPVMVTVYDGVDTKAFTQKGASDVKYTLITDPEAYEGLDLTSIETSGTIYAWPEAEGGKYEVVVEAELKSSPMIKNIVTYEVVVPQDLFVQINNASYSMNAGKYASAGLVAGENTLTVKSNRTFDVDEYYTIVAVYNGSELIACGVSDPTDEAGEATCTFNIPEEDLNKCKFRTFAWTKDLKPL